ncbi:hypothetical protein ACJO5Y_07315 [Marinobacter sp. GN3S48]|uniref:hypothetical protein n=1 Tax=Marinobacter sp. GN3S48 TaxID=3382302 RepID=UPI00387B5E82
MSIERTNNLSTRIAANIQTRKLPLKSKQKGASALEYIVLAAALIGILTLLVTSGVGDEVVKAFTGLFTDAASAGDGSGT